MARLDAKWYWGRGQTWYHFWQDTESSGSDITIDTATGEAVISGFSPTVTATDNKIVTAETGSLIFNGFSPDVLVTNNVTVETITGELIIQGLSPTITATVTQVRQGGGVGRYYIEPKRNDDNEVLKILEYFVSDIL